MNFRAGSHFFYVTFDFSSLVVGTYRWYFIMSVESTSSSQWMPQVNNSLWNGSTAPFSTSCTWRLGATSLLPSGAADNTVKTLCWKDFCASFSDDEVCCSYGSVWRERVRRWSGGIVGSLIDICPFSHFFVTSSFIPHYILELELSRINAQWKKGHVGTLFNTWKEWDLANDNNNNNQYFIDPLGQCQWITHKSTNGV